MHGKVALYVVAALLGTAIAVNYEGYKVYKVHATVEDYEFIAPLERERDFDFWTPLNRIGRPVQIMVAPKMQSNFVRHLKRHGISYEVLNENVESTFQATKQYHKSLPKFAKGQRITFDKYYQHAEINEYLASLAEAYPEIARLETIGQSYEGRDLTAIRISSGNIDIDKPKFFIDCGVHAREWITPEFCLYVINQLVEVPENSNLSAKIEWIILPVLNPDGYQYTWDEDRMWRKSRSPGTRCDGTDINRNFGHHWGETGGSHQECADNYAGTEAFSEIESRNLRDFLLNTNNVVYYLSFHSNAQVFIYPWCYTYDLPDNWQELEDLGQAARQAMLAVNGRDYQVGETAELMYYAAGGQHDWTMAVANISLSTTIELTGDNYGFELPPRLIPSVCEEGWAGVKVLHSYVENKYT